MNKRVQGIGSALKTLGAAALGGGLAAAGRLVADEGVYNPERILISFVVGALTGGGAYLMPSPLQQRKRDDEAHPRKR